MKLCSLILVLVALLGGCTDQRKTKEQLLSEGSKFFRENNPEKAAAFFKKALEKDPNYFEARLQLAKTYAGIGKFGAAEKELLKVRRQNPSSREAHIELARVKANVGQPAEALQELSPFLGDDSTDCDALEIAGLAHAMKKDEAGAITLLKRAVAACNGSVSSMLSLARVYTMYGDLSNGEKYVTEVLAKEPANRKALELLIDIQTRRKDFAAAMKTLDGIIQANPGDIEAQYRKGLLHLENGDYDKARVVSEALMKQASHRGEGHRLQGFIHFKGKKYNDAISPLQKSLQLQANTGAYYILGSCYYLQGEAEQAIHQFQKALDLDPSLTQARVNLAMLLLSKKRSDEAVKEAKMALAQDENNAMAHNILGSAYLAKGNYAEGIAELNKALAIDPSAADVHLKKGIVAMKRGSHKEVESELTAAVRLRPEAQEARRILALHYISRNEPGKAVEVLEKGVKAGHADVVLLYLMAEAYLKQNKISEATTYYNKAKEADPKYDLAYLGLASLHFMQGRQEEGVRELRSLLEKSPDNLQALLLLASFAEANGDNNEALKTYLRSADTGKTEGVVAAAHFLRRTNDSGKALKVLDEGIKRSPTDLRLQAVKGETLLADKKYKDALSAFRYVEQINPQLGLGYIVNTYFAMGEYAKALDRMQSEIKKNPTNLNLRAERSKIYFRMGKNTEAVENARDIIQKNPGSPVGYIALAQFYQSSGELDKGIDTLKSAPVKNSAALTFMLGNLYAAKKNYTVALDQYRKLEKANVRSDQVYFQKGSVLYTLGRKKEAADEFQKVLRLSPDHALALNNLAYYYTEENKNLTQALVYATRAFFLAPQSDSVQDTLGYVLLKNGRKSQGLNMLKKASESSPKNPSIAYHLALAYQENGDSARAAELLERTLALGDFPEAGVAKMLFEKIKIGKKGKTIP